MNELCEFDLEQCNPGKRVSSLDQYMNEEVIFDSFPGIGNIIVSDVVPAVLYLHNRNFIHRDRKPDSVLVSNFHYKSYKHKESKLVFAKEPITCKLSDLGEA